MTKKSDYKIPFSTYDGAQLHWADKNSHNVEWRDNEPFHARITFVGMQSGYSAKYLTVKDIDTGTHYTMFVTDALAVLQQGTVSEGVCEAEWVIQKRGQNYGIRLV